MVTAEGQIEAVRGDGMGMQAVDGAAGRGALDGPGSRCRWTADSVSVLVPGGQACYGVISADQVANASTRNPGLDLMDASVAYWC